MAEQFALHIPGVATVASVVCHPGLSKTNLSAAPSAENKGITGLLWRISAMLPLSQDASMGALPTLYAATGSDVEGGDYYGPGKFGEFWGPTKRVQPESTAYDKSAAYTLWKESEQLIKLKFSME
ncbi:LOW QUALITY PROTEIN: Hypothetical protein PHPALM_15993 [Phytophthora palmivora]|uniref:Short chain dehydrogenase n=1 Tax=Phytophthora palmivora TaxID=4796 RepID=A0A2P4XQS7_9STRA|nr:LOW QUALITY PROTEIN: Hypothetical protein PHPALM_15993 [Phytophthora palmivora]